MIDPEVLKWVTFQNGDTIAWQAPELLVVPKDGPQQQPHLPSDVYSLACTMLEVSHLSSRQYPL